jgi:hypothetical protein
MAAKPIDTDFALLADLADHAHRLLAQFIALPTPRLTERLNC